MRLTVGALVFALNALSQANAGSLGYTSVTSYMDWEPDCSKPYVPSFYISSVEDYNDAVYEFNNYVSEVESYLSCVADEAESDTGAAARAIQNGAEKARSEVISELDSVRSNLQSERDMLR